MSFFHSLLYSSPLEESAPSAFDDLTSYWTFDQDLKENGVPYDSVSANSISVITNATAVAGKLSTAYRFTGTNSYLSVRNNSDLNFSGGSPDLPFAFSLWILPTEQSVTRWILSKRGATANCEYQISRLTDGKIRFILFSAGGTSAFLQGTTNGAAALSSYSHVVCSYDGSGTIGGMQIWINGVLQTLTNGSVGTYVSQTSNATSNFVIGHQSWALTSTAGFIGDIDGSIGVFNRALTQTDVDELYNEGTGLAYTEGPNVYEVQLNVLAVRGSYQFASDGTNLYWSDDDGDTWINDNAWGVQFSGGIPVYNKWIDSAHIFSDGTLLFSCGPLLFRSTDKLLNITSVTAYGTDGVTPYTFHTPANAIRPGAYFQALDSDSNFDDDDNILVWTNYGNVDFMGAAPTSVWATTDKGATVRLIYQFGRHPDFRDDGSVDGGTSGTLLGDAGNSIITRHGHTIARNPGTNDWYSAYGDHPGEAHWYKHTYDPNGDTWTNTQIIDGDTGTSNTRYMSTAFTIIDGYIYWGSDATSNDGAGAVDPSERGVFKANLTDIQGTSERLLNPGEIGVIYVKINQATGKMILGFERTGPEDSIGISTGFGSGGMTLIPVGGLSGNALGHFAVAGNGFCKINSGRVWENRTITLFVKM